VRKVLPPREMLAEIGQAAPKRMAPRIDDFRVRQDQVDERHEHPVVRKLVDKKGPPRSPLDSGALEISLARASALHRAHCQRMLYIAAMLASDCRQVRKFRRSFDLRMRSEDLLDECRTG